MPAVHKDLSGVFPVDGHPQQLSVELLSACHITHVEDDMVDPTDLYHSSFLPLPPHPEGLRPRMRLPKSSQLDESQDEHGKPIVSGKIVARKPPCGLYHSTQAPDERCRWTQRQKCATNAWPRMGALAHGGYADIASKRERGGVMGRWLWCSV